MKDGTHYSTTGLSGTSSPITNEPTVAVGKNEGKANATTDHEQAILELVASYAKKLGKDYFLTEELAMTTFVLKPMLATDIGKIKGLWEGTKAIFAQPKLDGMRCIATAEGLFARSGKPITSCDHVHRALAPFFAQHPDVSLDGELYNHDLCDDFNKLISMCRKLFKPVELREDDIEMLEEIEERATGPGMQQLPSAGYIVLRVSMLDTHSLLHLG